MVDTENIIEHLQQSDPRYHQFLLDLQQHHLEYQQHRIEYQQMLQEHQQMRLERQLNLPDG